MKNREFKTKNNKAMSFVIGAIVVVIFIWRALSYIGFIDEDKINDSVKKSVTQDVKNDKDRKVSDFKNNKTKKKDTSKNQENKSNKEQEKTTKQIDDGDFNYEKVFIKRVVDGDTVIVEVDGRETRVRISGVDTPESVGDFKENPQYYGVEASNYTKKMINKKWVYLEYDEKKYDKYDRILAYIWTDVPNSEFKNFFNAQLISNGYAKWYNDKDNKKYARYFRELQSEAKRNKLGLWKNK